MSVQAMTWVLEHSATKGCARNVMMAIANHIDARGDGWCYVEEVLRTANCSDDSYRRGVQAAVELGELVVDQKGGGSLRMRNGYRPNRYIFPLLRPPQSAEVRGPHPAGVGSPQSAEVRGPHPAGVSIEEPSGNLSMEPSGTRQDQTLAAENPSLLSGSVPNGSAATAACEASDFTAFWTAYPRKTAKGTARSAWGRAVKAAGGPAVIVAAAARFAADPNLGEPRFIPHPATWLRAERWGDGPLPPPANGDRRGTPHARGAAGLAEYRRQRDDERSRA